MPFALPPQLEQLLERIGGPRRALIAAVGLGTVVLILGLSRWATAPTWVPVFSGLPLEIVGDVTQRLDEAGIQYRLEGGGGQLLVQSQDLARARVTLAAEGLPNAGRPGLELFDQPSWGMTDFAQRINYRRALEGELERTIGKMRGVEAAQVHLAMHETTSFRDPDRPVEASVVLRLRSAQTPGPDVVQGIQHLVASSIDGLESGKVTVLDDTGRMLSIPDEPGSLAALTNRQLGLQREVEGYLERKAEEIVARVVGPGNTRVQVSAAINFDRVERTTETLDPDRQVLAREERAEIIPGPEGGAGSTNSATTYENSRSLENFSGAIGNVDRLTVAVLVNHREGGTAEAPVLEERTAQELDRIETLVRSAVGIDDTRGDLVSVVSLPFSDAGDPFAEPAPDVWTILDRIQKPGLTVLALLATVFVALRALRTLRPPLPVLETPEGLAFPLPDGAAAGAAPELASAEARGALPSGEEADDGDDLLAPMLRTRVIASASSRALKEVIAGVEAEPELAARIVRTWLKES